MAKVEVEQINNMIANVVVSLIFIFWQLCLERMIIGCQDRKD